MRHRKIERPVLQHQYHLTLNKFIFVISNLYLAIHFSPVHAEDFVHSLAQSLCGEYWLEFFWSTLRNGLDKNKHAMRAESDHIS